MKTKPKTTPAPELFLGIDVGKPDLFCHIIGKQEPLSCRFDNTEKGVQELTTWLNRIGKKEHISACLEQTGHYGILVAKTLHKHKISALHLVNPRQIKAFGNQKLRRNKSDTADARLIAKFIKSEHSELQHWAPKAASNEQITELSRYAESITQDVAKLKTKCEAAQLSLILKSLNKRITEGEKEIARIRKRINTIIKNNNALTVQKDLLESIPGIGEISIHTLLAELPDLELFSNARQLAAWAGLTPCHYESGTSGRTKTPITKVGSVHLRRALFMPAMNARVFNPILKSFGDRLIKNGKKPKQAIIAIMRKLLHIVYGILKSGEPFNPEKRGFQNTAQA